MAQTVQSQLLARVVPSTHARPVWLPSLMQTPSQTVSGAYVVPQVGSVLNPLTTAIRSIRVVEHLNTTYLSPTSVTRTSVKRLLVRLALVSIATVYGLHN